MSARPCSDSESPLVRARRWDRSSWGRCRQGQLPARKTIHSQCHRGGMSSMPGRLVREGAESRVAGWRKLSAKLDGALPWRCRRFDALGTRAAYNEAWRLSGRPYRQMFPARPRPLRGEGSPLRLPRNLPLFKARSISALKHCSGTFRPIVPAKTLPSSARHGSSVSSIMKAR